MSVSKHKWFKWGLTALFAASAAYSFAAHFTGFIGASRQDKFLFLGSSLLVIGILSIIMVVKFLPGLIEGITRQTMIRFAIAAMFLALAFLLVFLQPPPFPEAHSLDITVLDQSSPLSAGNWVQILSVHRSNLPGKSRQYISLAELDIQGDWLSHAGDSLLWQGGEPGIARYQAFMQAGMLLTFRTGPEQGIVQITWDGVVHTLDLYSPEDGTRAEMFEPPLNWRKADSTRQLFVLAAFLADWISLSFLLFFAFLFIGKISKRGWTIRYPRLLLSSTFLLLLLLFLNYSFLQPVQFEDPNLEAVIRGTLKNPDKPILHHQLLTIAELDASSSHIFSLEGLQYLQNLSDLNLRENQITDLAPLSNLRFLHTLNLRENSISNLSPLSTLPSLVYLNLHSNPAISSIAPLADLRNLETLILANIQVSDEVILINRFSRLKHLNLRNTGISDTTPLANLVDLHYLNLHSNPGITSIAPLTGLSNLQTLILAEVPLQEQVGILSRFHGLDHLNLRNTGISDLSSLSSLTSLVYLNLHSNPGITSITPLAGLTSLQTLILENVPVADQIAILSNFPDLIQLNLRNTNISGTSVLGQLMANGAFQDEVQAGLLSSLDLRDNPLDFIAVDSYAPVRSYWGNLTSRIPYILPYFATLSPPVFSHPAGFYPSPFLLELSSDEPSTSIHYTLDGSEPTRDSPRYTDPILIESRSGDANQFSEIKDISPYWQKPDGEVFKARIVRTKIFHDKLDESSPVETRTYFIDEDINERYNMPVVSLVTEADYLFDYEDGVSVMGEIYDTSYKPELKNVLWQQDANYHQRGMEWERPIHIEVFEDDGLAGLSQNGIIRIHGGATRGFPKKSLRIYASQDYDPRDIFTYELFPGLTNNVDSQAINQFENFLLRNGGNDWDQTLVRDVLMQNLVSHTPLDTLAFRPSVVFLNGEYWGIYYLRQYLDENFLASSYQVQPDTLVILQNDLRIQNGDSSILWGNPGDDQDYLDMLDFVRQNDMSLPRNYERLQTWMDMDNFINYQVSEIYSANFDWPYNNIAYWRYKTDSISPAKINALDGRWRWILFDTDFGFSYLPEYSGYQQNTLDRAASLGENGVLLSSLLDNEQFRIKFINRTADQLNTTFRDQRVVSTIDQFQELLQPQMEEEIHRWRTMEDSIDIWDGNVEILREFARQRPDFVRQHIIKRFGLAGSAELAVETDPSQGYIRINDMDILKDTPGVDNPGSWSGIYFLGIPIKIAAVSHQGYKFSHWEGVATDEPDISLILSGDTAIKAVFSKIP